MLKLCIFVWIYLGGTPNFIMTETAVIFVGVINREFGLWRAGFGQDLCLPTLQSLRISLQGLGALAFDPIEESRLKVSGNRVRLPAGSKPLPDELSRHGPGGTDRSKTKGSCMRQLRRKPSEQKAGARRRRLEDENVVQRVADPGLNPKRGERQTQKTKLLPHGKTRTWRFARGSLTRQLQKPYHSHPSEGL